MVGLHEQPLRASAMNALAHGADSLYTPLANPVSELLALRGAGLIAAGARRQARRARPGDAGPRLDPLRATRSTRRCFGLHHVICQSLVRVLRTPHAETNAAMLPVVIEALIPRAGPQMTALARALGTKRAELPERIVELAGGRRRLSKLGADRDAARAKRCGRSSTGPSSRLTPDVPGEREIRELIDRAW